MSDVQNPSASPVRIDLGDDGMLDDLFVKNAASVHLEQMDTGSWWMRVERHGEPSITVTLWTQRGARIIGRAEYE